MEILWLLTTIKYYGNGGMIQIECCFYGRDYGGTDSPLVKSFEFELWI